MPFFGVPIRNGLPIGLGSVAGFGVQQFDPLELFASGANGVWYDPSDTSTLFQNGTTPVTAVEQPVGLMLDKSKGLVLGPELVTNGDFSNGATGWTSSVTGANVITISSGSVRFQTTGADTATLTQPNVVTPEKWYQVEFDVLAGSSGTLKVTPIGNVAAEVVFSCTPGRKKIISNVVSGTALVFSRVVGNVADAYIDNISVRELPGNHAISYNGSTARPTLSARVNLLTYSEQFDNAAWNTSAAGITVQANTIVAPNGTSTADKLEEDANLNHHRRGQLFTAIGVTGTFSVYAKAAERNFLRVWSFAGGDTSGQFFDLTTGVATGTSASMTDAGNGWWRCQCDVSSLHTTIVLGPAISLANGTNTYTGTAGSGIYIWGAQLIATNAFPANTYQRIAAATDYDTNGFPKYLYFAGTDDGMSTPANLNLTSTDKVTVFSGVRKLQTSGVFGVISEFSSNWNTNNGSFYAAVEDSTTWRYAVGARGTAAVAVAQVAFTTSSTYNSPTTNVLSSSNDIAGDSTTLQLNGAPVATATGDKGSGNFGSYPLYIGSRNNASAWFNGYLYGLTVVGAQLTTPQIESMENWTGGKTGISVFNQGPSISLDFTDQSYQVWEI